ncbi:uncharacterized protein LOC111246263 [Varroa destructor]|uniref:Uncharacterized protein n=1 Tax=Varroa destructor TaxID=109461 RepID=A0A7M7JG55_VARDE|nr:uncharacterized protein LOC111246263 [Varroa destructor]
MMRNLEPTPLIRSETEESVSSVGSDKTLSVASCDRPEIVRMIRKVDVKDETVSKGTVSRCQSVTSLASLRNAPCGSNQITNGGDGLFRRPSKFSIDGHNGFCSTRSSPELFEDASEFFQRNTPAPHRESGAPCSRPPTEGRNL